MVKHVEIEAPIEKMLVGMRKVIAPVAKTIGPCGTNVFLDDAVSPKFTNDGASIAHQITLDDKLENAGAWVARNACGQTNDDAGDGTTTTLVVLGATVDECLLRPENKTQVSQSLMEAKDKAITLLKKQSKPITQKEAINVARISAENEELAQLVTEVVGKVGPTAVITTEDRRDGFETDYKIVQGYEANVGFMSPYFRNDLTKPIATHTDIPVFCTAKKLGNISDIQMFEQLAKENINSIVIVAEEIDPTILGILVSTKMSGKMNILAIKATGPLLEDIANATGATLVSDSTGVTLNNFDAKKHLGKAQRIVCEEKRTVFISNAKTAKTHAERLTAWAAQNPSPLEKKKLLERAAKLSGGIAVIRIGAHTDAERSYLRDKADDTIHAVQSALQEGVVSGGGMALYNLSNAIGTKTIGEAILTKALKSPLRQIVQNAGKDYAEIIKNLPEGMGYNAKKDKYEDFLRAGVLDPFKVEKAVLENAIATAAKFITTHASVVDFSEPKD